MKKVLLSLLPLCLGLPALAADELPSVVAREYLPLDNQKTPTWQKADNPGFIYTACLNQQTDGQQHIVVMCGDGDENHNSGVDTGFFDIWYLNNGSVSASQTIEGGGRYGSSGSASAVKIGSRWGVVLETGYGLQGFEQTFHAFYVAKEKGVVRLAQLPVYSSNAGFCESGVGESCRLDELDSSVTFAGGDTDAYPDMIIHATGLLAGEKIDKSWTRAFDHTTGEYPIPKEIDISF